MCNNYTLCYRLHYVLCSQIQALFKKAFVMTSKRLQIQWLLCIAICPSHLNLARKFTNFDHVYVTM